MWMVCSLKADRNQLKCGKTGQYPVIAVPIVQLGQHSTRTQALRAMVAEYYPEHAQATEQHLARLAKDLISGSSKIHKIVNVK